MTKQEMFTKVWLGLQGQGWKQSLSSFDPEDGTENGGSCMYRGVENRKCAAGHLIPDEKYENKFESRNIKSLLESDPMLFGEVLHEECRDFVIDMQILHDTCGGHVPELIAENMRSSFENLARKHDLIILYPSST